MMNDVDFHQRRPQAPIATFLLAIAIAVVTATPAYAQTTIDGQRVEFLPSADNNTVVNGVAMVQGYSLTVNVVGTTIVTSSANLGKPTPDADGYMRVPFLPLLTTPLQAGVTYEARVYANGPGGSSAGSVSNPFILTSTCGAATLSPASVSVGSGGATGSVSVTSTCAWSTMSNVDWIRVNSGLSGTGNGVVGYSVAVNTTLVARSGTLSIAGATFTVNQGASACSYAISPTSQSMVAAGGTGSVAVTAGTGCAWTAASNATWLSVTFGASGSGNGSVGFSAAANTTTVSRSGTFTIAGATFTVNQAAATCSYAISPTSQSIVAAGGSGSVAVTAGTGCAWTAVSNATWLSVTSGASGSGNGTVGFSAAANTTTVSRSGTFTIAGATFTVNQAAATCSYAISPTSQTMVAAGGTGSVGVTAGTGCAWTAVSNATWLSVTSGASGSGNGTVGFSAAANTTTASRSGTFTIAGATFTVNQAAATCSYAISPTSQTMVAAGGTGSVGVTAGTGCAWTAVSNATWLSVTFGASASGNGTVGFSAAANSTTVSRSGTLTIAGATFTVNQAAACSGSISPTSQSVADAGGTGSVRVTASKSCAWTAVSNAAWLSVTSGASGSGNGTVGFSVAANTTTTSRSGTFTIAGATFTVNQSAACSYAISPTSQSMVAAGGSGSVGVTAGTGCAWTAVSNATWLSVTSGASGSGNGTVGFSAAANTTTVARSGTFTIAGATFTVNQDAAACSYAISPTSQSMVAAGGSGSVGVTAGTGCAWTAVSNATWLSVTSGASGSGNGTVAFSAAANTTTVARSGTFTIAGATFTVNQDAACSYAISPTSQSMVPAGGTGSVGVTAGTGCAWTAVSNATWLSVTSGGSGSGSGTVGFSAAANTTTVARSGTFTIAGATFTVNQAAAACSYAISPTSLTMVAGGGTGAVGVTAGTGCAWTAVSNATWLSVTSGASGSGNGTVGFSAAANTTTVSRTGTFTIAGATFTVNQAAAACTYAISPTSQSMVAAGGTGSVGVTAGTGCAWTAVSNATWLSVTSGASGSGNGTVGFSAAANTTTVSRTGTFTIAGATFTVNQAAAACTYAISPTSQSMVAAGGSGSVGVTAGTGCAWTAVSNATWLSVTSGASGSGNGTVGFSAAANTTTVARSGTFTIAGATFTVNQDAAACSYAISPTSQSMVAAGGTGSVGVTAGTGCAWTAVSNATWLSVTSGGSGSGNGTVGFSAAANTTTVARSGTFTIAGTTFTVNQAAAACTYAISPTSQTMVAGGGTGSVGVTAGTGCAWTAVSNATWLSVTSGASGSGNGTVGFTAAVNTTTIARSGTFTIAGATFTVNQDAAACTYAISPTSQTMVAGGGSGSVGVTAGTGCAWTAVSNATWLSVTSGGSGSGNGTVSFSAAANTTTARSGTVTIAGATFTVNQDAAGCSYAISPTSQSMTAAGGSGTVAVTSPNGCAWTAVSNATWLSVMSGASGSGNGAVGFNAAANTTTVARSATFTIAGATFTVNQDAGTCSYAISPLSQSMAAAGGAGTVGVTAPAGCAWTATSGTTWLTVTSGATGSGNGTVGFTAAANTTSFSRSGFLTIGGLIFVVNEASACSFAVSPTSLNATAGATTGTVSVATTTDCSWTAVSNAAWLSVTSGASGIGDGAVGVSVAANTTTVARTGTFTIAGVTVTVNQDASACSYAITPTSQTIVAAGDTGSIGVTAGTGCAWTAASNAAWLSVTSGASGSGNGTVGFSAAANTTSVPRSGTLTVAGAVFTVNQDASVCSYTISPTSQSMAAAGGPGTVSVTAGNGCPWTAASNATWLSVTAGATGSGNGAVGFSVAANTTTVARSGTFTIAGATFTINQAAGSCSYAISPTSQSMAGTGGAGTVGVTAPAGCAWTATSGTSWLAVTSGASGSGNGSVGFTAAANTSTFSRSGFLTIGGLIFVVNEASACSFTVSPTSIDAQAAATTGTISVTTTTGCAWTSSSSASWLTISASGSGSGTASYSMTANTQSTARTATIVIGGVQIAVTQAGTTVLAPGGLRIGGGN